MTASFFRCVSRVLILTVFLLPFQPIQAAMVPTDQLIAAQQQSLGDRDKIRTFLNRADVTAQLQALGVSPDYAKQRVDALTDEEVQSVVGKLDQLPAGGESGLVVVLLVLLVAWLVYVFVWQRR
jgi:hypothetical protein